MKHFWEIVKIYNLLFSFFLNRIRKDIYPLIFCKLVLLLNMFKLFTPIINDPNLSFSTTKVTMDMLYSSIKSKIVDSAVMSVTYTRP